MIKKTQVKFPSELRFDLVSKDWVVIATGRGKRPETFKKQGERGLVIPKDKCPFCNIETQEKPILAYLNGKEVAIPANWPRQKFGNWTTILIPNKYPAFLPHPHIQEAVEGDLYQRLNAVGYHELVITSDHKNSLALLSVGRVKEVLNLYKQRYLQLMEKDFVNYISIFHNHGKEAGASQSHPHSQFITTPLIDVDLRQGLINSEKHFKEKGSCVYCKMTEWERKVKTRIVFENKSFIVTCPFASKVAFEMIISPKKHASYFEKTSDSEMGCLAEAFKIALAKLYKALGDPAYNFYLHTAPCDGAKYDYYHWHWTILPKSSISAGFEIGTRMEISIIEPEKAAEYLRKQ